MTTTTNYDWVYSKVAFILDYEEATSVTIALVKRSNIWEAAELKAAVLAGLLSKANKRSKKELIKAVLNHCKPTMDERNQLMKLAA